MVTSNFLVSISKREFKFGRGMEDAVSQKKSRCFFPNGKKTVLHQKILNDSLLF